MGIRAVSTISNPMGSNPPAGFSGVSNVFRQDVTFAAGVVAALLGAAKTVSVPGLLTTDQVCVSCVGTMTAGAAIANARVSSADTLEITFTTAVALGVTLASLTYRVTVFR